MTSSLKPQSEAIAFNEDREEVTDIFFEIGVDPQKSYQVKRKFRIENPDNINPDLVCNIVIHSYQNNSKILFFIQTLTRTPLPDDTKIWSQNVGEADIHYANQYHIKTKFAYHSDDKEDALKLAQMIFHVVDLSQNNSFDEVQAIFSKIQDTTNLSCQHVFVGIKSSNNERQLSVVDLKQWAYILGTVGVAVVNPKSSENIEPLLAESMREILRKKGIKDCPSLLTIDTHVFPTYKPSLAKSLSTFSSVYSDKPRFASGSNQTVDEQQQRVNDLKSQLSVDVHAQLNQFIKETEHEKLMILFSELVTNSKDITTLQNLCSLAQSKPELIQSNENKTNVKNIVFEQAKKLAKNMKINVFEQELKTLVNILSPAKSKLLLRGNKQ